MNFPTTTIQMQKIPNHILAGIAIGLVVPFVGYALLMVLFEQLDTLNLLNGEGFSSTFRPRTQMAAAICLNVFTLRFFKGWQNEKIVRGIIFATLAYVLVWVYKFGIGLF
jgi:hypothetical protein